DLIGLARRATLSLGLLGATPGGEQAQSARLRVTGRNLGLEVWTGFARAQALVTPDGPVENSSSSERDLTGRVSAKLGFTTLDYEHSHHQADNVGLPAFNGVGGASGDYPLQGRDADRLELIAHPAGSMHEARVLAYDQTFHSDFTEQTVASTYIRNRLVAITTTNTADRLVTRERSVAPSWQMGVSKLVRVGGELRRETTGGPRLTGVATENAAGVMTSFVETPGQTVPPAWRDVLSANASTALP